MTAIRPRDLLSDDLLGRLGGTAPQAGGQPGVRPADLAALAEVGYLNVALPAEFGGLGCTLRQAACGQRRLARSAPGAALAVSAHLYWTGAAADAYRAGDDSLRWVLAEAAGGALFAAGHGGDAGGPGGDLRFADPRSRCEPAGDGGYQFAQPGLVSTMTPGWDWIAVHGVHQAASSRLGQSQSAQPQLVIGFAGRGGRCTPAFRVARAQAAGAPGDAFLTSALTWGHAILASVQYSDARRAFNDALTAYAEAAAAAMLAADGPAAPVPPAPSAGHWPVAEAGALLDAMKSHIADITHRWQLVQPPTPDLGGQHLISLYAMRHRVAEGAARVHDLITQVTGEPAPTRPLV
jgi:alkylation response protein AidB-like acyl-CoA dehydrogenase